MEKKHIGSSTSCQCRVIEKVEIPKDSKLQTIGKSNFYYSTLKKLRIPSSLLSIGEEAFYSCTIGKIKIPSNSEL